MHDRIDDRLMAAGRESLANPVNRSDGDAFRREIGSERATIMLPLNVIMVARIRGALNHASVTSALEKLRFRHPLLAVRVEMDGNRAGSLVSDNVPTVSIHLEPRHDEQQWISRVADEIRAAFPMETGPLIRGVLIQSADVSELILCAHHAICDGMSLVYLIRDILEQVTRPSDVIEPLLPPIMSHDTVSTPPSTGFVARAIIRLMNRVWRKQNLRFDFDIMKQLHQRYWALNSGIRLCAWELSEPETARFAGRCREESVTVNSAIWAAFLAAQQEVQGSGERFRNHAGLAISTRDKLKVPVGEAFGFYASSHKVLLRHYQDEAFWDAARAVHRQLKHSIDSANPFRMLSATLLDPTLLDSLYYSKYGIARNALSQRLLKKMMWDRVSFGAAITNVGRVDIPTRYGDLTLDAVYGPFVYSDVNEKTVGVITAGNRMTFAMSHNVDAVDADTAARLRDKVVGLIEAAAE